MALSPFFGRPTRSTGLSVWDPFAELSDPWIPVSRIWDSMNDDFSPSSALSSFSRDAHAVANTKVDWKETPESHVFTADLPGLKKEEVKVEVVDKGTLRISGERHREDVQENDRWHRMERSSGSFMRQFRLPDNVNSDAISAKMEDGVLVVTAPKANNNGGAGKAIDISA